MKQTGSTALLPLSLIPTASLKLYEKLCDALNMFPVTSFHPSCSVMEKSQRPQNMQIQRTALCNLSRMSPPKSNNKMHVWD